jgi:hypothetical protein
MENDFPNARKGDFRKGKGFWGRGAIGIRQSRGTIRLVNMVPVQAMISYLPFKLAAALVPSSPGSGIWLPGQSQVFA